MSEEFTFDELWYLYQFTWKAYKENLVPTSTSFLCDLSDKLRKMYSDKVYPKEEKDSQ